MSTTPTPPSRLPAACLAVFAVCGAGFSVLQAELAAHAALEPEWVNNCTRVGMGGFLTGTWLSVLFLRDRPLHTALSGLLLSGLALGITGSPVAATVALFAIAVGFAEVCLARAMVFRGGRTVTPDLMLAHAGWPVGFLLGTLLTAGLPANSLSLRLAFLLVNAVGALWMLRRTLAKETAPEPAARSNERPPFPLPLLIPLALLVGGIEFAAEARLLALTPAGWESQAFALLTILLAVTRLALARLCQSHANRIGSLLAMGSGACLLAALAPTSSARPFAFLCALVAFALGKAALWPGMLALASTRDPRHVRFIIPSLVTLGVLSPGLISVLMR